MEEKSPRKLIVEALMKHPEGLTLVSLAEIVGFHRHTATKYLHELLGAGIVYLRKVGPAKLCYLREKIDSREKEEKVLDGLERRLVGKKSQVKLIAVALILGILLASGAVIASNFLNETSNVSYTGESILNLTIENSTQGLPQENSTVGIISNLTATNVSEIFGLNQSETLNVTIPEIPPAENTTSELNESNQSEILNVTSPVEIPPVLFQIPVLNVSVEYPERITRGETYTIRAKVENTGFSAAKNISAIWTLPDGFEKTSEKTDCEVLNPNDSCNFEIVVESSLNSQLGKNDFKVSVNYES